MTTAVSVETTPDRTDLMHVVRASVRLGILQCVLIALFAVLQPRLDGVLELVICGSILIIGLAATILLPGLWTNARTIEGIAGAAGIGFGAAIVFLAVDVVLFQPLGIYTNRWLEIGGGSNWWYHPVWWMVGTYVPCMGAWILAAQTAKRGDTNPVGALVVVFAVALVLLALAVAIGVPFARFGLGGFSVAILPALAVVTILSVLGARRR